MLETAWESRWVPDSLKKLTRKSVLYRTDTFQWVEVKAKPVLKNVLTYVSREVLFHITGFYQWFISSSLSRLWMTDKLQSSMYLENCILKIWYKVQTERFETNIKTSEVLHESVTKQTKNKQLLIVNTINQRCNAMHLRGTPYPRCESIG